MFFMYIWIATQVVVEMLPISSSGHLNLMQELFKKTGFDIQQFFKEKNTDIKRFYYFLHLPTFIIICYYFAPLWLSFLFHDQTIDIRPLLWVLSADMVTTLLFWYKPHFIEDFSLGAGFLITSGVLFATSHCTGNKPITDWYFSDALVIGLMQAISFLPGVSRLAITCLAGCLLGFSLFDAFCLSWLLQVPLIFLAVLKSVASRSDRAKLWQLLNIKTCLAIIISSLMSWMILMLVITIIQLNAWYLFGWYMILPITIWLWVR